MARHTRLSVISLAMLLTGAPVAAATTISTSAYALSSTIKVVSTVGVAVGPSAGTSGTASPGYNSSNSVVSLDTDISLGVVTLVSAGLGLDTGLLTSNSTANGAVAGDTTAGSATSQVNDLSVNLFTRALFVPPVTTLGLTADTITSTTTVNRVGSGAVLVGNAVFENLDLTLLGLLNIDLGVNAQVAANSVLIDALGIRIVLNEQIVGGNGADFQSLTTNAINIRLVNYLLGGRLLTGNLIVGNSYGEIRMDDQVGSVPEPAVWLQFITGFGLAGIAIRRRTARALAI